MNGAAKTSVPSSFPGLWLHVPALLNRRMRLVFDTLHQGIATLEHATFVERIGEVL